MEKTKIYLDTSVLSALFDRKNPQRQFLTQLLIKDIKNFDAYISEVVLAEINNTRNLQLKKKLRKAALSYKILPINQESNNLANLYIENGAIPSDYPEDALHISIATVNRINYLLSWNFEHIVKIKTRKVVNSVNASKGYQDLEIITPAEIL